jgi:HAMP domain-containing protein
VKLWVKFSSIFVIVFCLGLAIAGYICHDFLFDNARASILQEARLMLESTLSVRRYTSEQIRPLIDASRSKDKEFHAQTIPAYAATENFRYLRQSFPEYSYKEATLNPTNLRDRAADWETDIIREFRDNRSRKELEIERETPMGRSLVLARPIFAKTSCLACHSTPSRAPASMIKSYGPANGFGWHDGEIVGAQVISVPMSLPIRMANTAFRTLVTSLILVGAATLIVLNLGIFFLVVRPVTQIARKADEVSKGQLDTPEFPVKGHDEISILGRAFNRMQRSLSQALRMLEQQ